MATKETRLYFEDIASRLKTKFSISRVWFVSLNVADASLVIWKYADPDPVKCSNMLQCISNTKSVLEVLAMKHVGTFLRLTLEPKNMDRQTSQTALGGDLLSARDSQRKAASYLPHPELASIAAPRKAVAAAVETDSEEEREIARDIKASQRHEAERMAEAKAAKFGRSCKGKGKDVVQETQKKKPSVPS
ncbi:hypothetical protein R1sor_023602 [Riccia sorocarpa]|uniref:Uncharacterized protein n=1 Tax=Riccia sorocarpa TaxID=122646 RepID=A0ABD3GPM5_9MARC